MRKFLRLSLLTAALTLVMSAAVWAADITEDTTLAADKTYSSLEISGDVEITVPSGEVKANSESISALTGGIPAITIKSGRVKITGTDETSAIVYDGTKTCSYFIQVDEGAELTLENVIIDGKNADRSSGKFFAGIENNGTLNVNDGAVIQNLSMVSYGRGGGGIENKGTVYMTGGEIKNNYFTGGGGLSQIMGNAFISGGIIHDCGDYSVYHSGGTIELSGGLIEGQTRGQYNNTGTFRSGNIVTETGGTVVDGTNNISVNAKMGEYLVANPDHDIYTMIGDKKYIGSYFSGEWHFILPTTDNHEIKLSTNNINISTNNTVAEISATIICDNPEHNKVTWGFADNQPTDVVDLKQVVGSPNVCEITAKKKGTTQILAIGANDHQTKSEVCTITVHDARTITTNNFNFDDLPYTDLVINASGGNLEVTIPSVGITVRNTNTHKSNSADGITVKNGTVTIKGGPIYYSPISSDIATNSIIKVENGATLNLQSTVYGKNKSNQKNTVLYGIDNEGTLNINSGGEVTQVKADKEIITDAIVNNSGTLTIDGGRIYGNEDGYAIHNVGSGTANVKSGAVVGTFYCLGMPDIEGHFDVVDESVCKAGIVYGDDVTSVTIGGNTYNVTPGETGVIADPYDIFNNNRHTGVHSTGRWDFEDKTVNADVSYVKGKTAGGSGIFASSHIDEANADRVDNETVADKFSVSTGFSASVTPVNSNIDGAPETDEYILVDISFPKNDGFIKSKTGQTSPKNSDGASISTNGSAFDDEVNGETLYKLGNVDTTGKYTLKRKFIAPKNIENDNLFGIIVSDIYSPNATAYIRACTRAQYEAANDYKEAQDDTAEEAGIAVVSLELE